VQESTCKLVLLLQLLGFQLMRSMVFQAFHLKKSNDCGVKLSIRKVQSFLPMNVVPRFPLEKLPSDEFGAKAFHQKSSKLPMHVMLLFKLSIRKAQSFQ
jgi:hypothetical protein